MMPMFMNKRCAVCGHSSEQTGLASVSRFGAPDLDMRPPEPERSTMDCWYQKCPKCGYIAIDIEEPAPVSKKWLKKKEYAECSGIPFTSSLAQDLYRKYLIEAVSRDPRRAYSSIMCAAWACDDARDMKNAVHCRLLALQEINVLIMMDGGDVSLKLVKADIMRRCGMFAELISEYGDMKLDDENQQKLLAFQLDRAKAQDANPYSLQLIVDS